MKQGAVLVDETDSGQDLSAVFLLEHSVQDGRLTSAGKPHTISQKLQFAAVDKTGTVINAGIAPHLNLRPAKPDEVDLARDLLEADWLSTNLEKTAVHFPTVEMAQKHIPQVRARRLPESDKVGREVWARRKTDINQRANREAERNEDA